MGVLLTKTSNPSSVRSKPQHFPNHDHQFPSTDEEKESLITTTTTGSTKPLKKKSDEQISEIINSYDPNLPYPLDFEHWYPILQDLTIPATIIELSFEEANAIIHQCEATILQHQKVSNNDIQILEELSYKYDQIIQNISKQESKQNTDNNNDGVFVRYSHRSPKDAVFKLDKPNFISHLNQTSLQIYKEEQQQQQAASSQTKQQCLTNSVLRGLVLSGSTAQCVCSGKRALELTFHSHRVYHDFKLGELEQGSSFRPCAIFRKFIWDLDFESEFRCFVVKGQLTAITQYHSLVYVHRFAVEQDWLKQSIVSYWREQVNVRMAQKGVASYVVDLGMVGRGKWKVIEVNPLGVNAGGALFQWGTEWQQLLNTPTKLRVRTQALQGLPDKLSQGMEGMFLGAVKYVEEHCNESVSCKK